MRPLRLPLVLMALATLFGCGRPLPSGYYSPTGYYIAPNDGPVIEVVPAVSAPVAPVVNEIPSAPAKPQKPAKPPPSQP